MDGNNERLLTPGEVAALFRVDPKTVTRWAASGRITSIRRLAGTDGSGNRKCVPCCAATASLPPRGIPQYRSREPLSVGRAADRGAPGGYRPLR